MTPLLRFIIPLPIVAMVFVLGKEPASGEKSNPVEIGTVPWGRDIDAALALSKKSGKPVFLLFQEVPG